MAEFAIRLPTGLHSGFSVGVYSLSLRLTQGTHKAVRRFTQQMGGWFGLQGKSTHRWACVPDVWGPNLLPVPAVQPGSLRCPVDVCRHEEALHGACCGEALY